VSDVPADWVELIEGLPSPGDYLSLREAVGWSTFGEDAARAGLERSLFGCVLIHDGRAVGCGRVVGDGAMYFYIQDVIVLPELRGRGHGRRIMDAVMAYLDANAPLGAFVGLMAADGVAGFYERYGFAERPAGLPGMYRVWE
jgi:ribosomal protein S18 acetylase RimI-like enzyme